MTNVIIFILFSASVALEAALYFAVFGILLSALVVYGYMSLKWILLIGIILYLISIFFTMKRNRVLVISSSHILIKNLLSKETDRIPIENISKVVLSEKFNGYHDNSYFSIVENNNKITEVILYPLKLYTKQIVRKMEKMGIEVEIK